MKKECLEYGSRGENLLRPSSRSWKDIESPERKLLPRFIIFQTPIDRNRCCGSYAGDSPRRSILLASSASTSTPAVAAPRTGRRPLGPPPSPTPVARQSRTLIATQTFSLSSPRWRPLPPTNYSVHQRIHRRVYAGGVAAMCEWRGSSRRITPCDVGPPCQGAARVLTGGKNTVAGVKGLP